MGVEGLAGSLYGDVLRGDAQFNLLVGLSGNDTLDGRGGSDVVAFLSATGPVTASLATGSSSGPGEGTDSLAGVGGLAGSDFGDTLTGDAASNLILGGGGDDHVAGGGGNDALTGDDGKDEIDGGDGNDQLYGDPGDDHLDGGAGAYDTVSYELVPGPVTLNLGAGTASGAGSDTLSSIGAAEGSPAGDAITGDGGVNVLSGLAGDDTISGLAGNDILDGGTGTDTLDGGADNDTCANGENTLACEIGSGSAARSDKRTVERALGATLPRLDSVTPSAALPPDAAVGAAAAAAITDDSHVQSGTVECWLRYVGAQGYDITISAPWTPHAWSGAQGETEWFIPRIYRWDPSVQSWVPATEFGNGGWGLWAYTYPGSAAGLITIPFGGPWFNGTTGNGYATTQWWSVSNGYYYRIAGWVEWHDAAGNLEAYTPLAWMWRLYGADASGPWCYG